MAKNTPPRRKSKSTPVIAASAAQNGYESHVIYRALERAGANPQLKGHIHEILTQDRLNLRNVLSNSGQHTALTQSTQAQVVDLVTTRGGQVVERMQLKDVVSPSQVNKVVRQVSSGKYNSARLIGTDETTKLVNQGLKRAGSAKQMTSSGVSTDTTTRLAQRAGATGSGTLGSATLRAAHSGGTVGAAVGAGVEVVRGISDLMDGSREPEDVALSVAAAGAKGYATGAAASAAATVSSAALMSVGAGSVMVAAAPVAVAVGVGIAVTSLWDAIFD
jgi:hypothetical protein